MKVCCQLVIMVIYLCHNYIHTALTYSIPIILINWLSILWTNSTMDAEISKLAEVLSVYILYAHMHRKEDFCYPIFIINKNKIHRKEMHWAFPMELVHLRSKFFMSLYVSAVWGRGWENCSKAGFRNVKNIIWIWRINNIYWLLLDG